MTITDPLRPSSLDEAVVATVAYSDIFDMPIEVTRLRTFLIGMSASGEEIVDALDRLVDEGRLEMSSGLAHLPGRSGVLPIHAERVARAEMMWCEAARWGARLGRLPFVRSIAVTGGLACDSVADHDDIDYLVITEPGRLWTARALCVGMVHLGRLRHVDLCPNYLVAIDSLALDEQTSYTARELAQMVDIVGAEFLDEMRVANDWLLKHLPNAQLFGEGARLTRTRVGPVRRLAEALLGLSIFDRFETWEMNRKIEKLKGVVSRREEVAKPDESSFSPSVCKGHMVGNAAGIEVAWRDRLRRNGAL